MLRAPLGVTGLKLLGARLHFHSHLARHIGRSLADDLAQLTHGLLLLRGTQILAAVRGRVRRIFAALLFALPLLALVAGLRAALCLRRLRLRLLAARSLLRLRL